MGIRYFREPELDKPSLVASWPGIGNIGVVAVDTLRSRAGAEELAEIESPEFFYPQRVIIRGGVLTGLEFPSNRFYYQRVAGKDLIIFVGEEQPAVAGRAYAEGEKAYEMANRVLDVAARFKCQRVYTSGAAVALTHHSAKPRVWAVANREALLSDIRTYENTVLMSQATGRSDQGAITGLNGLLLGVARKRGMDAICFMGEIPDYLSQAPFPYPRASKSVVDVLSRVLGINVDSGILDGMVSQIDEVIENVYEQFPPEIKERIDNRKSIVPAATETITPEDEKWIKEHIDEFFQKGDKGT